MPFIFILFQEPPFLSIEIDIYSAKALLKMLIPSGICHVFGVVLCHLKPFSTLRNQDSSIGYANSKLMFAGEPTAIETIETSKNSAQPTYDLQGRRLTQQPRKGVYVRDGRKVVVK